MNLTTMLDDFMIRAFLAGCGLCVAAGPLGCFVVWRRMAYFGDAISHAAILGVALSLAFSLAPIVGVLIVVLVASYAIARLSGRLHSVDTLLGVVAHLSLALGLVAVSKLEGVRLDLHSYLFGDILAVTMIDVFVVWGGALLAVSLIVWRWVPLLTSTLNPDLAAARDYDVDRERVFLMLSLALLIAVAIKLVGALLISAILIIPAAAARGFSRTPEQMAVFSVLIGIASVAAGLMFSLYADTPSGPSIVVATGVFFVTCNLFAGALARNS